MVISGNNIVKLQIVFRVSDMASFFHSRNIIENIIIAIAGILLKSQEFNFFQYNSCRDIEYLLKNSDILFVSEYKREI